MEPITIAVLTDLHLAPPGDHDGSERECARAQSLLRCAAERLSRAARPAVTLLLGDLVDDGRAASAPELYHLVADAVRAVGSPVIAIPGNHDGEAFFEVFPRPAIVDHAGMRFVCLLDPEEPEYNARRTPEGLALMRAAREGYSGPIVALQHVPVFPPGTVDCPYGYLNASEVVEAMREQGITLAVAGHYHAGFDLVPLEGMCFHATRALCERPFCFDVLTTDGTQVSVEHHTLEPASGPGA
jgi:3',5'-cyclic AMP phosphodiesterase CpdA